jgi:hypothetical protein
MHKIMPKTLKKLMLAIVLCAMAMPISALRAEEAADPLEAIVATDQNSDGVTAQQIGATSEAAVNNATSEATESATISGTLIEIGNTTAQETTVVIRTTENGQTVDKTVEVSPANAILTTDSGAKADLSDWIAGDQVSLVVKKFKNSGRLVAEKVKNKSFKSNNKGVNGWIKAIRADKNEVDVLWGKNLYTVNLAGAKLVAGAKNPATISDLKLEDRVRLRVIDDGDKNPATWKAKILVVLRRGNDNFMRVTRWVVPAKIVSLPTDLSLPTAIEVEVVDSKFYQKGDVNNLVGEPGTKVYIDISTSTQLVRRFLGKSLLSEYSVGDSILVVGRRNDATGHIDAKMIKNDSIQALGVAQRTGLVTSVDPSAGTISVKVLPVVRGQETVTVKVSTATKIFIDGKEMGLEDITIGDVIKAKGVFNRNSRAIDAKVIGITSKERISSIKEKAQALRDRISGLAPKSAQ